MESPPSAGVPKLRKVVDAERQLWREGEWARHAQRESDLAIKFYRQLDEERAEHRRRMQAIDRQVWTEEDPGA